MILGKLKAKEKELEMAEFEDDLGAHAAGESSSLHRKAIGKISHADHFTFELDAVVSTLLFKLVWLVGWFLTHLQWSTVIHKTTTRQDSARRIDAVK